jgi:hypothetical protein
VELFYCCLWSVRVFLSVAISGIHPALELTLGKAVVCDFPYIVNHAIEQPLDIYFDLSPQSKAIQAFVCPDVGKDGFSYGYSARIDLASHLSIDLAGHFPGKVAQLNGNGNP